MRYKAKSVAVLQLALGGLPDRMRGLKEQDIGLSANTVGELQLTSPHAHGHFNRLKDRGIIVIVLRLVNPW